MKYTADLVNALVHGPYMDNISEGKNTSLSGFIDSVKDTYPFSTGILPLNGSGLLSIQRGFGFEQIIYQLKPEIATVRWGASEGQQNKAIWNLAVPYRIYIADYKNGAFVGCRHFYSPTPIFHWDQPLYVPNLPNTNCVGYRGTSVGWVCLYLHDDTTKFSFLERVEYFISRMSGVAEPYNDANMSETDGPRFYQNHQAPDYMWDPTAWSAKTASEGFTWICDPNVLIPFTVSDDPKDHAQTWQNGQPQYTLARAANQPYSAYYSDTKYVKPWMKNTNELDINTLMTCFVGTGTVIKPAPKELSIKDLKELLSNIDAPRVKSVEDIDKLLSMEKIKLCAGCNTPSTDLRKIHTNIELIDGLLHYSEASVQLWCMDCCQENTKYFPEHGIYVSLDYLIWNDYCEDHILKSSDNIVCPSCELVYSSVQATNCIIYQYFIENNETGQGIFVHYGCKSCVPSDFYDMDHSSNLFVTKETMKYIEIKKLETDLLTGKLALVDSSIWTSEQLSYCKCKLFTYPSGSEPDDKICSSCEQKQEDGSITYIPFFNFSEQPTKAII